MSEERKVVLIGEDNPYGADPRHALFCWPERSAGWNLAHRILGLRRGTYLRKTVRYNLCEGKWSAPAARERAHEILVQHANQTANDVLVLLGRRVVGAFYGGPDGCPQSDWPPAFTTGHAAYAPLNGRETLDSHRGDNLIILPHPSGRNLIWNDPMAVPKARALFEQLAPWLPVGELSNAERDA